MKFLASIILLIAISSMSCTQMQCPLGQYFDTTCKDCGANVAICTSTAALICNPGYKLTGGACTNSVCPTGSFYDADLEICVQCEEFCTDCNNYNQCTTCQNNYDKQVVTVGTETYSFCKSHCGFQQYMSATTCVDCTIDFCLVCESSTVCNSCFPGYTLSFDKTQCRASCQDGQYYDPVIGQCQKCDTYCNKCTGPGNCLECTAQATLTDKVCNSKCGATQFWNIDTNVCTDCSQKCGTCLNVDTCLTCAATFVQNPISNLCFNCQAGEFFDYDNDLCISCPEHCEQCTSADTCSRCNFGFKVQDKKCVYKCPAKQSYSYTGECVDCADLYCQQCYESPDKCDACSPGYNLVDGKCQSECPEVAYYKDIDTNTCLPCNRYSDFLVCSNCHQAADKSLVCDRCNSQFDPSADKWCTRRCKLGQFYEGRDCVDCTIDHCLDCIDHNYCLSCKKDYILSADQKTCEYICPVGYYFDDQYKRCFSCIDNCDHCDVATNKLTSCNADGCSNQADVVVSGTDYTCTLKCIQGKYYDISSSQCKDCSIKCKTCSDYNTCTSCNEDYGYFMNTITNQCKFQCTIGQRWNKDTHACENCGVTDCIVCTADVNQCTSCSAGYDLVNPTTCAYKCNAAAGEFYDHNSNQCLLCKAYITGCAECAIDQLAQLKCSKCQGAYKLETTGTCTKECDTGKYYDVATSTCKNCIANCLSCNDGASCSTCYMEYKVDPSSKLCVYKCSGAHYYDIIKGGCLPCIPFCESCLDKAINPATECDANKCFATVSTYNPDTKKCDSECPIGQFPSGPGKCEKCGMDNCKVCSTKIKCMECQDGFNLSTTGDKCNAECKLGEYFNTLTENCQKCYQGCSACTGPDAIQCTACLIGYKFDAAADYKCASKCDEESFYDLEKTPAAGCATCDTKVAFCDSCYNVAAQTATKDNVLCQHCNYQFTLNIQYNKCIQKCQETQYFQDGKCYTCGVGFCSVCEPIYQSSKQLCLKCKDGYKLSDDQMTCTEKCTKLQYWDLVTNKCVDCKAKENCEACDTSYPYCMQCSVGYKMLDDYKGCAKLCKANEYYSLIRDQCIVTSKAHCTTVAATEDTCTACEAPYILSTTGICITKTCPAGQFWDTANNRCSACPAHCTACTSLASCSSCSENYYGTTCQSKCDDGTYYDTVTKKCEKCKDHCLQCNSLAVCDVCDQETYEFNGFCNACSNAIDNCSECVLDNNNVKCEKCSQTYDLNANKCDRKCPETQYYDTKTNKCTDCKIENCHQCSSETYCEACNPNYLFDKDHKCIKNTCGAGQYFDDVTKKCQTCIANCQSCEDGATCQQCVTGYQYLDNKCVNSGMCPAGYWHDVTQPQFQKCKQCMSNCIQCTSYQDCQACTSFYYLTNNACAQCGSNCEICKDNKTCTKCQTGYQLDNGECSYGTILKLISCAFLLLIAFFY